MMWKTVYGVLHIRKPWCQQQDLEGPRKSARETERNNNETENENVSNSQQSWMESACRKIHKYFHHYGNVIYYNVYS